MSEQVERPERPTTPVTIVLSDGKERVLRYSLGSMKRLKELFGKSLMRGGLMELDEDKLPLLIWHGLRKDDPDLSESDVEELIDAQSLAYVMSRFAMAFGRSEKNAPEPAAASQPNQVM